MAQGIRRSHSRFNQEAGFSVPIRLLGKRCWRPDFTNYVELHFEWRGGRSGDDFTKNRESIESQAARHPWL